jgi:DNA-binding IclR family transcriptional regulator
MRKRRPIDAERATVAVVLLIAQHVGKPCPTRNQIIAQTGLPKREVWRFMDGMSAKGLIEIEERSIRPGNWRRMRLTGGAWTDWTSRRVKRRRHPLAPREELP